MARAPKLCRKLNCWMFYQVLLACTYKSLFYLKNVEWVLLHYAPGWTYWVLIIITSQMFLLYFVCVLFCFVFSWWLKNLSLYFFLITIIPIYYSDMILILWSIDSSIIRMSRVKISPCRFLDPYLSHEICIGGMKMFELHWLYVDQSGQEGSCCLCVLHITPS